MNNSNWDLERQPPDSGRRILNIQQPDSGRRILNIQQSDSGRWILNILWQVLYKHKEQALAMIFFVLEAISFLLDEYGNGKLGFVLAALILSASCFTAVAYAFIKDRITRTTTRATRSRAEKKLTLVEVVFSIIQLVVTFIDFIKTVLRLKTDFTFPNVFPLAFSLIILIFALKNEGNGRYNLPNYAPTSTPDVGNNFPYQGLDILSPQNSSNHASPSVGLHHRRPTKVPIREELTNTDMDSILVPPAYRFSPTEEELLHYLHKKNEKEKIDPDVIPEVDLNSLEPWDISEKCKIGSTPQRYWYFFSHKDNKYPIEVRANCATLIGSWKTKRETKRKTKVRKKIIYYSPNTIGLRKTLAFYKGQKETNWVMDEYRLDKEDPKHWVVCRLYFQHRQLQMDKNE